jgi:hypothetical protein
LVLVLALVYGQSHFRYFSVIANPDRLDDDTRIQLFHFYRYGDSELFANDVIGKYHSDGTGDLFRLLYIVAAKIGDPLTLSHALPPLLLAFTLAGLAVAGHNIAGRIGAFIAMACCLSAGVMLSRLMGGLPRSFAYPFLAWCAAALTAGHVRSFVVLTALGTGFYPVCAVVGGIAFALWLFVMAPEDRGQASEWPFKKRVVALAVLGLACAVVIAPFAIRMRPHGPTIKTEMVRKFPEAGPHGRNGATDRPPFPPFFQAAEPLARRSFPTSPSRSLLPSVSKVAAKNKGTAYFLLALVLLAGFARLGFASPAVRRLGAFGAAVGVGYVLANAVTPSLVVPQRYAQFGVPVVLPLAVAAALKGLFPGRLATGGVRVPAVTAALGAVLFAFFGTSGPAPRTKDYVLKKDDKPLYGAVAELPKSALVAGWPYGVMDQVPLVSKRTAFLTRQLHIPYHAGTTLLMRERMRALIAAYFATESAPIEKLRDQYGVTHLVIELALLKGEPPKYFEPFDKDIRHAVEAAKGKPYAVLQALGGAEVFRDRKYAVLDLARVGRQSGAGVGGRLGPKNTRRSGLR